MSKIKLTFDKQGNIEVPTLVLCRQNCSRIAAIPNVQNFVFSDNFGNAPEMSFTLHKNHCSSIWNSIKDFRNVYVPEWNTFFQLKVDINQSTETSKSITATHLAEVELSNILNPVLEIYTETDIDSHSDDAPTIFYNINNTDKSALHRILAIAVNYEIDHVDETLCSSELRPTISETSQYVYDTLVNLGAEISVHFEFDVFIDPQTGKIRRTVSAYDLESTCNLCGERGEFNVRCPECGSTDLTYGYGEDTTIFVSRETLADNITFTTDKDNVKNCFYLESNDPDFIAAVINCNPNGSQYLWYLSPLDEEDMSRELWNKLYAESSVEAQKGYYQIYDYYQDEHDFTNSVNPTEYNKLYKKYSSAPFGYEDLEEITTPIKGYTDLTNAYYNEIDMLGFLTNSLMPSINISVETTAKEQENVIREFFRTNTVAVKADNIANVLSTQADSAVSSMAEILVAYGYKVKVSEYSYAKGSSSGTWKFSIENEANEDDVYISETPITVKINTDFQAFVEQKIKKTIEKGENKNYGIAELVKSENLADELKSYGLVPLQTIEKCVNGVISILADMDINADNASRKDVYEKIGKPYAARLTTIQLEIATRQAEINEINKLNTRIESIIKQVHEKLNLEKFLGEDLWRELNIYRRESTYTNSNYMVSDTNAKTIEDAKTYIEYARKELIRSATLQHSISSSFKNLMAMKEFAPLRDHFAIGNWLRIEVDEEVYKLRLISYQLDFSNYQSMSVEFSDVVHIADDFTDIQSVVENAKTMGKTYSTVEKQATNGKDSYKLTRDWTKKGLDATLTQIMNNADNQTMLIDESGAIFRRMKDDGTGYEPEQMKIINSTLAMTKNGWSSLSTAVGKFLYEDPQPSSPTYGQMVVGYGVNAEMLIGNVILGNNLGIHTVNEANQNCHMTMNGDGLIVTNGTNTFTVNPNNTEKLLSISNKTQDVFWVSSDGMLHIEGDGSGLDISSNKTISGINGNVTSLSTRITQNAEAITLEAKRASAAEGDLSSSIKVNADNISLEVKRASDAEGSLSSSIKATAEAIRSEVTNTANGLQSQITQNAKSITSKVSAGDIASTINQTAQAVTIDASKININGAISANKTFKIDTNGFMTATGGTIGGWTIGNDHIFNNLAYTGEQNSNSTGMGLYGGNWAFWAGNGRFSVTQDGVLYANNVNIEGIVRAKSFYAYDNVYLYSSELKKDLLALRLRYNDGDKYDEADDLTIGPGMSAITFRSKNGIMGKATKSSSSSWGEWIFYGDIYLLNDNFIYTRDKNDKNVNLIGISSGNNIWIGSRQDTAANANVMDNCYIVAKNIYHRTTSGNTSLSDERHKKDIQDIDYAKDFIMSLKPRKYKFKEGTSDRYHNGFLANEVKESMDSTIGDSGVYIRYTFNEDVPIDHSNPDTYIQGLRYEEFIAPHIQVTQEHENRINELEQTIKELKEQIRQLTSA